MNHTRYTYLTNEELLRELDTLYATAEVKELCRRLALALDEITDLEQEK